MVGDFQTLCKGFKWLQHQDLSSVGHQEMKHYYFCEEQAQCLKVTHELSHLFKTCTLTSKGRMMARVTPLFLKKIERGRLFG